MAELFSKFGEFDSYKELNMAAAGQLQEGDLEALKVLAAENGIDPEDTEDYINGDMPELCTTMTACFGRIKVQLDVINSKDDVSYNMAVLVIATMLKSMCTDHTIATAVMKKGKRIDDIYQAMKNGASKHKSGNMGVSCGTDRELAEIIKAYFLISKTAADKKIEALYK